MVEHILRYFIDDTNNGQKNAKRFAWSKIAQNHCKSWSADRIERRLKGL